MDKTSNYVKYETKNPVMIKIIARFMNRIIALIQQSKAKEILDIGCGEGFLAQQLFDRKLSVTSYRGVELSEDALAFAKQRQLDDRFGFHQGNVFKLEEEPTTELTICLEVLEHLEDPSTAVKSILSKTEKMCILSVPWEPWFRLGNLLRGKYTSSWGNHPEHIQHFSPSSFKTMISEHATDVKIITCFPWIIAIATK